MNIIFKQHLNDEYARYTVLDLDTFELADGTQHTACCVIENTPVQELSLLPSLRQLHGNLIKNLSLKNWDFCEQAIEQLMGKWGGEVDTFYQDLLTRVQDLKTQTLPADWTPVIHKQ
jgi:hypothetical protein